MEKKKTKFSKFMNNPLDFVMLVTIILLFSIGVIMVLSASSPTALSEGGDSYSYFRKQLMIGGFGIGAMLIISKLDYRFYQKFYKQAWIGAAILLGLVLVIGSEVNGAKRWIDLGSILSFQPSEIVKILVIIFYAGILTKNKKNLPKVFKGLLFHGLLVLPIIGLLMLQPHMSASVLILAVVVIMLVVAGCRFRQMLLFGVGLGGPIAAALIIFEPYRLKRVMTFLDPWSDPTGDGWQIIQSLYAIGSGGLFGVGLRRK